MATDFHKWNDISKDDIEEDPENVFPASEIRKIADPLKIHLKGKKATSANMKGSCWCISLHILQIPSKFSNVEVPRSVTKVESLIRATQKLNNNNID